MYSCNLCKQDGKEPFTAPADPIGAELMKAHLTDVHGVEDFPPPPQPRWIG